jgi:hypothetical protein
MIGVVLVVDLEDGKRLSLRGSRIVAALGGLNGLAGLCGAAGRRFGVFALGVRSGGRKGSSREAEGQSDSEDVGSNLHCRRKSCIAWMEKTEAVS